MTDSRSALLAAAAEEFARHGPKGARIQAIVQRAGVNERMIYHHFGSKGGLYAAVLEAQAHGLVEAWRQVIDQAAGLAPYEGMRTVLAGFADVFAARPLLVALTLHEALGGWRTLPLPTADEVPFPKLRELYERGQRQGVFRADCPFEIAHGVAMSALVGSAVLAPRGAEVLKAAGLDADPARLREQVVGQLLDGMTGPPRRTD
ncbi:MAG TPA: TetR/AcrR family transcriptional regulator [Actinomycetes bacterium]|jgi:AcrR family transcriptional regulator|nr:TetR/AcrR family transcriptional regulator [Actinomycetes bacterium]